MTDAKDQQVTRERQTLILKPAVGHLTAPKKEHASAGLHRQTRANTHTQNKSMCGHILMASFVRDINYCN